MGFFHAVLLGVVQGLTEFLPVSSSGHLVLFHRIFDISKPTLLFDTMLHVGTLAGVFAVLRKDIWAILRRPRQPLTAYLIIATIPLVIAALVFRGPLEKAFETGRFLGASFLLTSALLVAAELLARRAANGILFKRTSHKGTKAQRVDGSSKEPPCLRASVPPCEDSGDKFKKAGDWRIMSWRDALVIGVLQAAAVIPGLSRSGTTLAGALLRGLNRELAARFVFLLSIPAIFGAAVFQLIELAMAAPLYCGAETAFSDGGIGAAAIIAGTLTAAFVGFFAVRLMLKIVREKTLWGFALYTGILGLLVLLDQFVLGIVF
jgi:undecaprenyl-diphosphatase